MSSYDAPTAVFRWPRWRYKAALLAVVVATVLASALTHARAQPLDTPAQQELTQQDLDAVARRIARAALLNLRGVAAPTQGDYHIAALVLDQAWKLTPANTSILRRTIEAWHAAGNAKQALSRTRSLLRLAPDDQTALLRVVSASVSNLQSVEDRLDAYDRLLAVDALPASVRSNLALDASLLAREQGDNTRFVDLLTRATQLDATNKQAAALAATYYLERNEDPRGRIEILANLLLADPLDASTHSRLAQELLAHGAYEAASRFLDRVDDLATSLDLQLKPDESERLWLAHRVATWGWKGHQAALDEINDEEQKQRDRITRARYQAEIQDMNPDDAAAEFTPNPAKELTRLVLASASADDAQADMAIERLADLSKKTLDRIADLLGQDEVKKNPDQVDNLRRTALLNRAQMVWFRLWSGLQLDDAEADLDRISSDQAPSASKPAPADAAAVAGKNAFTMTPDAIARNRGWLAAQRGDRAAAQRLLKPLSAGDELARLGLARAADLAGDKRSAILGYARLAIEQPATLVGMFARTRVEKIIGKRLTATRTAASLNAYAMSLPRIIDDMTNDPTVFISLKVEQSKRRLDPLDPLVVTLRLGNNASIPLAVGNTGPIGATFLITPRITARTQRAITDAQPEITRLGERLRLEPRDSFEQTVWVGGGQAAQLLDLLAAQPVAIRWSVLQSFVVARDGTLKKGRLALRNSTGLANRPPAPGSTDSLDDLVARLTSASGRDLLESLLIAASLLVEKEVGVEPRLSDDERTKLAQTVADRLPDLDAKARAFAAVIMPTSRLIEQAKPIDEALRADDAPLVRAIALLSRVEGPDDPMLIGTIENERHPMRELASLVQRRFRGWEESQSPSDGKPGGPGTPVGGAP